MRSFNVHRFLKGVQECRSDASLRSVDVCLTSNLSSLIVNPFLKGVQECRSDASLRSVDVCLTSKSVPPFCKGRLGGDSESFIAHRSTLIVHRSSFNVHRSSLIVHRHNIHIAPMLSAAVFLNRGGWHMYRYVFAVEYNRKWLRLC